MKQQYVRLFSFIIGCTFIVSGVIFMYTKSIKAEKKEKIETETKIADEIGDVYKTFYKKEKTLSKYREKLIDDMSTYFTYYIDMPKGYKSMIDKVAQYEEYVKESEDMTSYLKENCNKKYSVAKANEKCSAFYINLEKTINVFVEDLSLFNSKIDEYNEWIKTENKSVISNVKYKSLDKYESEKYTDYVDLNKDGIYLGKNND